MKRKKTMKTGIDYSFLVLAAVLALTSSCAQTRAVVDKEAMGRIIWPGPPEKPRIAYQWSMHVVSGKDGADLSEIIAGREGDPTDPRTSPGLLRPYGIFVDGDTLYIADTGACRVTLIDLKNLQSRHLINAGEVEFLSPVGVAALGDTVYVSDSALRKVFMFNKEGHLLGEFQHGFQRPTSLAVDRGRKVIYISDSISHTVYSFDPNGLRLGSLGSNGLDAGEFNFPTHLWVDHNGSLYVTDGINFRIQEFSPEGRFTGMFGVAGDADQNLERPKGVATDSDGNVYVVDSIKDVIKIFTREGRLLLVFGREGREYGDFYLPSGIFIDVNDNIYVADTYNGRIQVFQYLKDKQDR